MTALGEIEFVNAIDKRYQVVDSEHNKPTYSLISGVKSVDFRKIPSSQNTSTTSTSYLIQPQLNNFVSTMLYEEVEINFAFNFTTTGALVANSRPFPEGSLCTSFLPLSQASNTLTVSLNGTPFKVTNSEILRMVMSFNKTPELNGRDLMNGSQLDTFTDNLQYSSSGPNPPTAADIAFGKQQGSLQSNKNTYFSSTYGTDSRFGSVIWTINNAVLVANTPNQIRNVSIKIREPLFSGITSLTSQDENNWVGLSSLEITRTFVGNVAGRMISWMNQYGNAVVLNGEPAWSFVSTPNLYYKLTLMPDDTKIPLSTWYQGYSYDNISIQQGTAIGAGLSNTLNSQTINLSHVPRAVYIAVMVPLTSKTVAPNPTDPNAILLTDAPGFQIQGIQVTYGGPGQFASLSNEFDVYKEFCLSENYNKTWTECGYAYYQGAGDNYSTMGLYGMILRIDSSKFQLDWSKYSVGCAFNASLSVSVKALNLSSVTRTPSLFIVPVNDIVYQITNNTCFASKGLLTEIEVEQVRKMRPVIAQSNRMIGGNVFDSIWSGLKTAGKWVYNNRDAIVPIVKGVASIAGLGVQKASQAKNAVVRRMKGRGQYNTDDDLTDEELELYKKGGSVLTKSDMKHKLKFIN